MSILWFYCAKGTKPNFFYPLPRFPAEFEYIIIYKQMRYGLFSLLFSKFSFILGDTCQNAKKNAISMLFALQESLIFTISLRPSPISFVHCHDFLRNLSMTLHIIRWHMAYFLCNFQDFPLLWTASAISIVSMVFLQFFSVFLCFGRLLPKMLKKL